MGDFDAESAKKAGNDMFSSGDYEGACMKYTDAIMMGVDQGCTFHSKLLSNRLLALLCRFPSKPTFKMWTSDKTCVNSMPGLFR